METIVRDIRVLVDKRGMSIEEAIDFLDVPEDIRDEIRKSIENV